MNQTRLELNLVFQVCVSLTGTENLKLSPEWKNNYLRTLWIYWKTWIVLLKPGDSVGKNYVLNLIYWDNAEFEGKDNVGKGESNLLNY